uniref:Uncharacterized protein n=1 Tax=Arundo donax TaxID=35708 RepID=A0A0A8YW21_ARUDO
MKKRWICTQLR